MDVDAAFFVRLFPKPVNRSIIDLIGSRDVKGVIDIEIQVAIITGVFTLCGVLISGAISLWTYWFNERQRKRRDKLELYKKLIEILNEIQFAIFNADFDEYCAGIEKLDHMFIEVSVFASDQVWEAVGCFLAEAGRVTMLDKRTSSAIKTQKMRNSRKKHHEILRLIRCEVGADKIK